MSKKTEHSLSTKELTKMYNELADKPVKVGTLTKKQLYRRIDEIQGPKKPVDDSFKKSTVKTVSLADLAREKGLNEKVVRAKFRRMKKKGIDMPELMDAKRWIFRMSEREEVLALM